MSNSSLVAYTQISPCKTSPRTHTIDTITIHCTAGQMSVESLGALFAKSSGKASSNYGIGSDGRIGMYVEEADRSWCSSKASNDHRAITIECSSDATDPYAISDTVYNSLITLLVDVCQRNGIESLKWQADKSLIGEVDQQNMTVHRWFANKACPGDYIYNRLGQIADEVNAKLGVTTTTTTTSTESTSTSDSDLPYLVKVTSSALRIRSGPGTNYSQVGTIRDKGTYTITEESTGTGATLWGKLKSGAGWIALDYTTRV